MVGVYITHSVYKCKNYILIFLIKNKSSKDIRKELQRHSMTKTYSVDFNYDAELHEFKRLSFSGDILCKIIKQSD